jgi:hypothetical protein
MYYYNKIRNKNAMNDKCHALLIKGLTIFVMVNIIHLTFYHHAI